MSSEEVSPVAMERGVKVAADDENAWKDWKDYMDRKSMWLLRVGQ